MLFIGGNNNPLPKIFDQNINSELEKSKYNGYIPKYKFVNTEEELENALQNDFDNKVNLISLTDFFGENQIELFLKAIEKQKHNVEIIHGFLVGVDKFLPLINEKVDKNVIIANAKGSFSESLGEYVVFSCLYHAKKTKFFQDMQRQRKWIKEPINMIKNKNVAIFGFGDIGQTVGRHCKNMGMKVIAVKGDPTQCTESQLQITKEIYGMKDSEKVLGQADYVVGVMPLVKSTDHFFDLNRFKQMKKDAIFINIGRGQSVVEKDLVVALKENIISGASLDVFEQEPLSVDSELWDLENAYLSQHCADCTHDFWELTYETFIYNMCRRFQGKPMKNIVDRVKGY